MNRNVIMTSNTVTISLEYFNELRHGEAWIDALESAGIDNWDGLSFAHELLEENFPLKYNEE